MRITAHFIKIARAAGLTLLLGCLFVLRSAPLHAQSAPSNTALAAHLERGQAALKANEQALATQEFRAVLELDPNNVVAHANLGVLAFFHGNCRAAEPEFRSALRVAPTLTKAEALLSICEKRMGQPSAQADLQSAFAKLKDAKLRTQVGVELADLYYRNGDLDHTLPILQSLVTLDPDNVDLLFFAQRVYSEMADNTLNKLALLAPDSARMQQLIAERLINGGDLNDAIDHYRKALAADPRLPGMHFELAEAILESSNDANAQAAAKQELEDAIKVDGDSAGVESALARIDLMQSKTNDAYAHYQRAYAMNPNEEEAQLGLAKILADENKPEQALPYLLAATEADPLNALAHYRLARVYHALHQRDAEEKQINLYKEIRTAKDRVAALYRQMNRRPEAQEELPPEDKP